MLKVHLNQDVRQGLMALPGGVSYKARVLYSLMDKDERVAIVAHVPSNKEAAALAAIRHVLNTALKHDFDLCRLIEDAFDVLRSSLQEYYLKEPPPQDRTALRKWHRSIHGVYPPDDFTYEDALKWLKAEREKLGDDFDERVQYGEYIAACDEHDLDLIYGDATEEMYAIGIQELAKVGRISIDDVDPEEPPLFANKQRWNDIKKAYILPDNYWEANSRQRQVAIDFYFDIWRLNLKSESSD
jgi:hypothetical protein